MDRIITALLIPLPIFLQVIPSIYTLLPQTLASQVLWPMPVMIFFCRIGYLFLTTPQSLGRILYRHYFCPFIQPQLFRFMNRVQVIAPVTPSICQVQSAACTLKNRGAKLLSRR